MPTLKINGRDVTVPKGTPILRAAAMVGVNIPHFCYHPALSAPANCRMCLVEVEKARKLEPSCYLKCTDGMVVHTESPKVVAARKAVLEFILINHPVDCPICDQAGECKLQDYYMAYDARPSRLGTTKVGKAKVYPIGPNVVYDGERCILCTRCVRFCDEVTGTSELTVVERGDRSEIRTFPGKELNNPYSMNVTDICPVGALTTRDFRFKCRVWLMSSTDSICVGCAKGCSIHMEHFQGEIQRYRPRFNPEVNEYWMCDSGRLSYKEIHTDRIADIRIPDRGEVQWPRAARIVAAKLKEAIAATGGNFAVAISAQMTTEGMFAARAFFESIGTPKFYWTGKADGNSDELLIHADKNPNRAGLRAVFGDSIIESTAARLANDVETGRVKVLYLAGSHLPLAQPARSAFVAAAARLNLFVLHAAHHGGLSQSAHIVLPAATHAEQEGTFVNEAGVVQHVYRAFEPKGQSLPDWEIFSKLAHGADSPLKFSDLAAIQNQIYSSDAAQ